MKRIAIFGVLLSSIVSSYAVAASGPSTLPQPVKRTSLKGFSFQPADVPGWLMLANSELSLALTRRVDNEDETAAIQAGVLKVTSPQSAEQFADAWKESEVRNTDATRFTTIKHDVESMKFRDATCVRSRFVVEDHAPHTVSKKHDTMILDAESMACEHPNDQQLAVYITYSERRYPEQVDPEFDATAGSVLNSLAFEPLPQFLPTDRVVHENHVDYTTAAGASQPLTLLGGKGNDWSRELLCAKDGSCTLFGFTNSSFSDTTDQLIAHLGPTTDASWAEIIGGGNADELWHGIATSDNGYFTVGASASGFHTDLALVVPLHRDRPLFMRLDGRGKILWAGTVELDSDISGAEIAATAQPADGGFVLAGSYSEAYPQSGIQPMQGVWSAAAPGNDKGSQYTYPLLIRLSADGKPIWMRRYAFDGKGGSALTVTEMPMGHLLLTGSIYTGKKNTLFVLETDPQGVPLHTWQYAMPQHLGANALIKLVDGKYLLVGHANTADEHAAFSAVFGPDLKLMKGAVYEDSAGLRPLAVVQGAKGAICVAGRTENPQNRKAEGVAWEITEEGTVLRELWLSGQGNTEIESAVAQTDGTYWLLGDTDAFNALGFDQVMTTWDVVPSSTNTKRIKVTTFAPDSSEVKVSSDTAVVTLIQAISPEAFEVIRLTSGTEPKP